jgi:hypothetical protein
MNPNTAAKGGYSNANPRGGLEGFTYGPPAATGGGDDDDDAE